MSRSFLAVCLLLVSFLHGCGSGIPGPDQSVRIDWLADPERGAQSATLDVPLSGSSGESAQRISLALRRYPATGPKLGSIVLNPGGPGASAVDYLDYFAESGLGRRLRKRFDLVAFDPRGVGYSTPVRCVDDPLPFIAIDLEPANEIEYRRMTETIRAYSARCVENNGDLLQHVSTMDVVRDLERIRRAMGEGRLNYIGFSYGTKIGALYADTYPQNVRAMVLDGVTPPSMTLLELALEQAAGFERSLQAFLAACRESACRFGGENPEQAIVTLLSRLKQEPLQAEGDRRLGYGEAKYGLALGLYSQDYWPLLELALADADAGDGSLLLSLTDDYFMRAEDGSYPNAIDAFYAVSCADAPRVGEADVRVVAERASQAYPTFGAMLVNDALHCTHWPVSSATQLRPVSAPGAPPIMVVGTTGDPATPYAWSQRLADELDASFLVTLEAERHVAAGTDDCVDERYEQYLLEPDSGFVDLRCRQTD